MTRGFTAIADGRHGAVVYLRHDHYTGQSFERFGEYSPGEIDLLAQIVRPGDTVVEVGAHIGAHTLPLARLVGPTGAVHAFEPQRIPFQTLCATMALNSIGNVRASWAAVGDRAGTIDVPHLRYDEGGSFGGLALGPDADWKQLKGHVPTEKVQLVRLDGALLGLEHCRLIKADVEGMEIDVLRGAERLIDATRPALYLECNDDAREKALGAWLAAHNYRRWWHVPPLGIDDKMSIMILALPMEWDVEINAQPLNELN